MQIHSQPSIQHSFSKTSLGGFAFWLNDLLLTGQVYVLHTKTDIGKPLRLGNIPSFPQLTPFPSWSTLSLNIRPRVRPGMQKQTPLKTRRSYQDQMSTLRTKTPEMLMRKLRNKSQETKLCYQPRVGRTLSPLLLKLTQVNLGHPVACHLRQRH